MYSSLVTEPQGEAVTNCERKGVCREKENSSPPGYQLRDAG